MAVSGNDMGDDILDAINTTPIPARLPLFRAWGNGIVQALNEGINAAGAGDSPVDKMALWVSQVAGTLGVPFGGGAVVDTLPLTFSTVTATLSGAPGTVVPVGSVAAVDSVSGDWFTTQTTTTLGDDGTASVAMQAQSSGAIVCGAHRLNTIVSPVDGWTGVDNPHAAAPGVDPLSLDGNMLGDAIRAAIDAVPDKTDRTLVFRAIGNAIVDTIAAEGIAATADMVTWMAQVETVANGIAPRSVAPLSATFNAVEIVA